MKQIYFVSRNKKKFSEMKTILEKDFISIEFYKMEISELQTVDAKQLLMQKAQKAFQEIRRPVLVEHTALIIKAFNNLPGLQTNYFYSNLGYQEIVNYCELKKEYQAIVKSMICICDGKEYLFGEGIEEGSIIDSCVEISEDAGFDWDKIFIPYENNPEKLTYYALKDKKNERSMRKKAWDDMKLNHSSQLNKLVTFETYSDCDKELETLARLIKEKKVLLFIGAGISASVGLPSWSELIGRLGKEQGYAADIFKSYGDYMMLAEYVKNIDENKLYEYIKNIFGINNKVRNELETSTIYEDLFKMDFPVIYTTNFDHLLEEYYSLKGCKVNSVVKIEDMENIHDNSIRIMKFHGDIDERDSIVLAESQYFERMSYESFMDVQLQADMLKYHILFLGYSLSDINVKLLLYLVRKRWNGKTAYIYTATPNEIQKKVFEKNNIVAFSGGHADKKTGTQIFLKKLVSVIEQIS